MKKRGRAEPFLHAVRRLMPALVRRYLKRLYAAPLDRDFSEEAHTARIRGKRLRYLMELCAPFLGGGFRRCYAEVKDMVSLTGDLHDRDKTIRMLGRYARDLETFNRRRPAGIGEFRVRPVKDMLGRLEREQRRDAARYRATMRRWKRTDLEHRILDTLGKEHAS